MKILVSGGAGFIGSEFVRQGVMKGHQIVVVDKLTYAGDLERIKEFLSDITFYKADIKNLEFVTYIFDKEKPDIVVHFAAESHVDRSILSPFEFLDSNVLGTYTLLDLALKYKVQLFINVSTDEVYGELGEDGKFFEDTPLNPNSPYSVSKASADMLGRAYYRTYGLPVITVRPSNNYGPWQYPEKLIPVVIAKALKEEKVPVYGKGLNVREWLYVEDCVKAIFSVIDRGKIGEVYNIASGEERKNIEVVKAILGLLGKPYNLIEFVEDRPGHDFRYSMSIDRIKKECGWEPGVNFEEGIEKTVRWYLEHKEWLFKKIEKLHSFWEKVYK